MGDLSRLETVRADEGVWFTPVDHEGNDIEYEFLVLGSDSKVALKAMSDKNAKILDAFYERRKGKGKKAEAATDDAMDARLFFLSKIVKDWRVKALVGPEGTKLEWKGNGLPCTPENVLTVLSALPAIADQIDHFCAERGNFTKPASEN